MNRTTAEWYEAIFEVVLEIPEGKVATYGQIASLLGLSTPRIVGRALKFAGREIPCHRVVNHQGRTAPGFMEQRILLEREGVSFLPSGLVDLKKDQWETK